MGSFVPSPFSGQLARIGTNARPIALVGDDSHQLALASGFTLTGTIGQPDAGRQLSGGGFFLNGGFWPGAAPIYRTFLPLVVKG
jgi:hypothetical protein